jgi:O-antigen ligase
MILFEFFGHNLAQYPAILSLIIPPYLQQYGQGSIDSTFSHPNYVSGLSVALFVFFLTYTLLETRLKHWLLYLFFALASFVLMLASLSSSGFVSLLIIFPLVIAVAFLSWARKQTLIKAGVTVALCLAVFLIMNAYNPDVAGQTIGIGKQVLQSDNQVPQSVALTSSKVNDTAPETSRPVSPSRGSSSTRVTPTAPESDYFKLPAAGWYALTGRTYIWQETLKLIKARPILGYGQDTLAYYFPQNDINKIAGVDSYDALATKPHNFYLGMAFGSGIPALLAMLALFIIHFYHTSRRLLRAERNQAIIFPAALFLFFCGFTVQWLVNDSVIGSAVIFWTLLGVGVSLNLRHPEY